ncbi:hypothetical protein GSY74_04690 [Sulfurovum sp. bin170]|uniref:hypothetical protein n=1 Tax=Sulfurovum sp. bin170 TaxID=2695268 RepID=UPI0013DFBBDB|nr:hypothetical protein [Sulfurovum sp. bin170]NEW60573.1 hypothetical protein [Sulfurovum sp. bin170]
MNILIQILILMTLLELVEANFHKAPTLGMMIDRLYGYYKRSVFLFFAVHPTFYFVLLVSLYTKILDFYIIVILIIKVFDIFFKIEMIQQRHIKKEMDIELASMMDMEMSPWMGYLGTLMYVPLLAMALFN